MHENSRVQIAMVQMPGLNTPQFEWARNKFSGDAPGSSRVSAGSGCQRDFQGSAKPVRELWVGSSTVQSIVGQFFPAFWIG